MKTFLLLLIFVPTLSFSQCPHWMANADSARALAGFITSVLPLTTLIQKAPTDNEYLSFSSPLDLLSLVICPRSQKRMSELSPVPKQPVNYIMIQGIGVKMDLLFKAFKAALQNCQGYSATESFIKFEKYMLLRQNKDILPGGIEIKALYITSESW